MTIATAFCIDVVLLIATLTLAQNHGRQPFMATPILTNAVVTITLRLPVDCDSTAVQLPLLNMEKGPSLMVLNFGIIFLSMLRKLNHCSLLNTKYKNLYYSLGFNDLYSY